MREISLSGITSRSKADIVAGALAAGAVVLYRFPPGANHFYPLCPVFHYLHVLCPGCGATRAIAALLHGRLADALHYNPLAVIVVPLLGWFFAKKYLAILQGEELCWPAVPLPVMKKLILVTFLFGVFRNAAHVVL